MEIHGTVTITLRDYAHLHRLAKKGTKAVALQDELLERLSQTLSAIVYDPDLPQKNAHQIIAKVKRLSTSLPQVEFWQDPDHNRIILEVSRDE